jgi:hypothetical protein
LLPVRRGFLFLLSFSFLNPPNGARHVAFLDVEMWLQYSNLMNILVKNTKSSSMLRQ